MDSFDLDSFKLDKAVMEIRYGKAYVLWDCYGRILSELNSKWPDLKMRDAKPNNYILRINGRYDAGADLEKAYFIDLTPASGLKEFKTDADFFLSLIIKTLDIRELSRLGFRLVFRKKLHDKIEASESWTSMKMMSVPHGKHFNIKGKVMEPNYSLRWEGESMGVRIMLNVQNRQFDLDPEPYLKEIEPIHIEKHDLVYDIDYYTLKNTLAGQLNIPEWISQVNHLIRRDSNDFFNQMNKKAFKQ
jgi:plasmid maintenance system killer protein